MAPHPAVCGPQEGDTALTLAVLGGHAPLVEYLSTGIDRCRPVRTLVWLGSECA